MDETTDELHALEQLLADLEEVENDRHSVGDAHEWDNVTSQSA